MLLLRQDVYDKVEYLSSLGKTQTAAVQRDADIGVAEAERDAGIRVGAPPITCDGSPVGVGLNCS